jgi:hypothetical protein
MKDMADLIRAGRPRHEVQERLGINANQYFSRLRSLRKKGLVPPRPEISGLAWADDRHRCGAGPQVGSRADLLDNIGIDLLQQIAAECPAGVTLMQWIAAILKDAMNDAVPPAAAAVRQLDAGPARGAV